jgi:DNA-binding GntR family transcriptional regulator
VYLEVRSELLSAQYQPGQWMKVADLQRRYGWSLSVIREALSRLAAEGLLVAAPQRGFRVVQLSMEDLHDLTEARIKIETLVLREALAAPDRSWEARLLAAGHQLDHTPLGVTGRDGGRVFNPEFIRVHAEFHETLLSGCSNVRLLHMANSLRDSAELYRMWTPRTALRGGDIASEHRSLTKLALDHKVDACVELLVAHIEHTRQALIQAVGTDRAG